MSKVKITTTGIDREKIKAAAIDAIDKNAKLVVEIQVKGKFWTRIFGRIIRGIAEEIVQKLLDEAGVGKIDFDLKLV